MMMIVMIESECWLLIVAKVQELSANCEGLIHGGLND